MPASAPRLLLVVLLLLCSAAVPQEREALLIPIQGAIGVATAEIVADGVAEAEESGAAVLILRMDTPGGLDQAMRQIIKTILAAEMPVVGYVAPSGARAASAGTYILYACHVAAMAPATTLGAATPVQVGGLPGIGGGDDPLGSGSEDGEAEPEGDTMQRKLVNDAAAYIRALAELRGRNAEWAEKAVRESVSLQATAALEQGVIDLIADDVGQLLERIDGRRVQLVDGPHTLETKGLVVRILEPGWRARLLSILSDPNVAYILMLIGIYGLIFEMSNPGAMVPGIVGAVCLVLALYALQLLPVDYAGLALILLGIALMTGEAFAPSFGMLGISGFAAFVIGSVMLVDEAGVSISIPVIASTGVLCLVFSVWVLGRWASIRHRAPVSGSGYLVGQIGEAREAFASHGWIQVAGESWQADTRVPVQRGQRVRVLAVNGLRLEIEPVDSRKC